MYPIGSILCLGMESGMWFYDFFSLRKENRTLKYRLAFAMAALVGFAGIFICGAGVSAGPHCVSNVAHFVHNSRRTEPSKISRLVTPPTVAPRLGAVGLSFLLSSAEADSHCPTGADNSGSV